MRIRGASDASDRRAGRPAGARVLSRARRSLTLAALGACLAGCASFHPVERTPEGILDAVKPGDTIRIRTRQQEELEMLVWTVSESEVRGRLDGGDSEELRSVRFDRIQTIDVERLDLKKAMLSTFVPVVVGAIIFCNNEDCETRSAVTADF